MAGTSQSLLSASNPDGLEPQENGDCRVSTYDGRRGLSHISEGENYVTDPCSLMGVGDGLFHSHAADRQSMEAEVGQCRNLGKISPHDIQS